MCGVRSKSTFICRCKVFLIPAPFNSTYLRYESVCCRTGSLSGSSFPAPSLMPYFLNSSFQFGECNFKAAFCQRGELRCETETQSANDQLGNPWWKWWLNWISSLCPNSACQSHQGSTALPSSNTAPASGTGEVWLRVCPPGSALLDVCTVAGALRQEALSKRSCAWQVAFHGAVAIRHFYCMTYLFGSEVWHSLLFKLQYCTYTGNKSLICDYYGFAVWT